MGDLTKGYTFSAGEVVTAAKLHALVEDATVKAGMVGTTELADGSVTTAKLASGVAVAASQLTLASGKVLVGNGSNVGAEVAVDTATMSASGFGVKTGGIAAAQLATDAVETAKIKDGNVTLPKLAAQATATIVANATGGSASPTAVALGTGLEFSGGVLRVTTAVSGGGVTKIDGALKAIPSTGSQQTLLSGIGGTAPRTLAVFLECTADDAGYLADSGDGTPDRIPIEHVWVTSGGSNYAAFGVRVNGATCKVVRYTSASSLYALHATTGVNTLLTSAKWSLRAYATV